LGYNSYLSGIAMLRLVKEGRIGKINEIAKDESR
jgi:hypothetical protein